MRKLFTLIGAVMLLNLAILTGTGTPASAGASGCNYWGAKTVGSIPLAKGTYCVALRGSGQRVDSVFGQFTSVGNVCNWNITMEYFDTSGRWYRTWNSSTRHSCSRQGEATLRFTAPYYAKKGFMCSTLKQNGARVTSVCHNIY